MVRHQVSHREVPRPTKLIIKSREKVELKEEEEMRSLDDSMAPWFHGDPPAPSLPWQI